MEIKEHDPEDLAKGLLRLGREFKSKPVDITGEIDNLELVPCWKQTGNRSDITNEDVLWLWDKKCNTKYELLVNPKFKNYWYICLNGRSLGILNKEADHYTFSCNYFAAFHIQRKGNREDVLNDCLYIHSQGHEYR